MKAKLIGRGETFEGAESKKSKQPYHFAMFHCTYKKPKVEGIAVKEQFVSFLDFPAMLQAKVGDIIDLDFDGDNSLLDASIVPPAPATPQPKSTK